jgi:hypothetical protein
MKTIAAVAILLLLVFDAHAQQTTAPVAASKPPVSDILSWINGHFEKSAQTLSLPSALEVDVTDDQREYYQAQGNPIPTVNTDLVIASTRTYSISFQDCSVTLTQRTVNDATLKAADTNVKFDQKQNVEHDSTVIGPFDLGILQPDKIVVEPSNTSHPSPRSVIKTGPRLKIASIGGIANTVTIDGADLIDKFGLTLSPKVQEGFGDKLLFALTPSKTPDTVSEITIDFATPEMADRQAKAWRDAIGGCGGKTTPDNLY